MPWKQMGGISTFQATTVTATSICSLLILILRSSRGLSVGLSAECLSHTKYPGFHKDMCRARSGFAPRIEQTAERGDVHRRMDSVYSLASRHSTEFWRERP